MPGFNISMLEKKFIAMTDIVCAKTCKLITSQYCSEPCKLFVRNYSGMENSKSSDFVEITSNQVSLNQISDNYSDDLLEKLESKVICLKTFFKKLIIEK